MQNVILSVPEDLDVLSIVEQPIVDVLDDQFDSDTPIVLEAMDEEDPDTSISYVRLDDGTYYSGEDLIKRLRYTKEGDYYFVVDHLSPARELVRFAKRADGEYMIGANVRKAMRVAEQVAKEYMVGNDIIAQIAAVSGEWPSGGIMPGTQHANGKKLIHAMVDIDAVNPLVALEMLILAYELDWTVEAMQEVMPTQELQEVDGEDVMVPVPVVYRPVPQSLVDYIPDIVTYDQDGNEASRTRPLTLPPLHKYMINGQADWVME